MTRQEYHKAVDDYSGRLYRFVFKCLRHSDDSRDIVQESYEKLWENLKKVEWEKCRSWLFTVAYHKMINHVKTRNRVTLVEDYGNHTPSTDAVQRQMEAREIMEKALAILPPLQQSIVLLRDLEGYEYKDIAEILKISESQVKVYLFRARQKLKEYLKDLTISTP